MNLFEMDVISTNPSLYSSSNDSSIIFNNFRNAFINESAITNVSDINISNNKSTFEIYNNDIVTVVEYCHGRYNAASYSGNMIKRHFSNTDPAEAFDKLLNIYKNEECIMENALYNFSRSRLYMEEDTSTDDDDKEVKVEIESPDDDEIKKEEKEIEEDIDNDDDLKSFGTDTSDVQNDYNPEDISLLNKLVASESEAINDYFDAAKDSHDENLRRLYGDIGHEERFHLEQLLYAKSTLTGEKYEPRDPDVKKEYEELVAMGMDEETAASTAVDKVSISISSKSSSDDDDVDDGDDSDVEELAQEAAFISTSLYNNEILTSYCRSIPKYKMDEAAMLFVESFIYMEEVGSTSQAPKELTTYQNPIKILYKGLKAAVNGLSRLSNIVRKSITKNKIKNYRKHEWIKKHGIGALFKSGIEFYLYSDKLNGFDIETPVAYIDLLYQLSKKIGDKCGIKLADNVNFKRPKKSITFVSIEDGMNKLKNVILTKTKVLVNEKNKDAIARDFFGYSDTKMTISKQTDDGKEIHESANVYNQLNYLLEGTKKYSDITAAILEQLNAMQSNTNSIYYKNKNLYNQSVKNIGIIVDKYNHFISCMGHDLKMMLKLDKGLLDLTTQRDTTEQTGGKWEGEDIRVNNNNKQNTVNPYIKSVKNK